MPVIDAFKNLMRKHPRDGQPSAAPPTGSASSAPTLPSSAAAADAASLQQQQQQQPASASVSSRSAAPQQQQPTGAYSASAHHASQQQQQQQQQQHNSAVHGLPNVPQPPSGQQPKEYPYGGPQAEFDTTGGKKERLPVFEGLEAFQLIEKMGDGAFSNVFKAIDRTTGSKVAVKVVRKYELNSSQNGDKHLNPNFKKRPRVTERANILKEVQIMRGVDHPSIIKLISFSESSEHYFLVLELMEGGELFHQIVKLTYFSEQLSRHVILQVAHGIRYLHEERGVVHRDIKPENILFERIPIVPSRQPVQRQYDEEKADEGEFVLGVGGGGIGRVKIADFGLSKIVWAEDTATPCGTVGYTAPEIVKDERYSKSVDMWALGCVLYTLLCGFPPFYDESIAVLTEKVARGYYTFLSPWWDEISASAKDLITHLLCVDPAQRYTIDEFLAHPWCREQPAPPAVHAHPPAEPQQQQQPAHRGVPANAPLDSPLLASMRGPGGARDGRSPGLASLKEAFDVANSVHRMEEEGARRRAYNGPGGAGPAGFLHGLNEDDEGEEDAEAVEEVRVKHGDAAAASLQHRQQQAHTAAAAAASAPSRADQQRQYQAQQQQQQGGGGGYQPAGGADRKLAEAALYDGRAGQRDRGRSRGRGGGFELDMSGATLLGKRAKKPSPLANSVVPPAPASPPSRLAAHQPVDAGSPMRY